MKLVTQVRSVTQRAGKPWDPDVPLEVVWEVQLSTHPHVTDIELTAAAGDRDFAAWASTLKANDFVTVIFQPGGSESDKGIKRG